MNLFLYKTAFCHGYHCTPLPRSASTPVLGKLHPSASSFYCQDGGGGVYKCFCLNMHSTMRQLSTLSFPLLVGGCEEKKIHILPHYPYPLSQSWLVEGKNIYPLFYLLFISTFSLLVGGREYIHPLFYPFFISTFSFPLI